MGSENTKEATQSGDQDVTIIENREVHTGLLESHDGKINIVLGIVAIQMLITILGIVRKQFRKQALKAAKSVATLDV